jgi:type IV secretory pathway VirJ component
MAAAIACCLPHRVDGAGPATEVINVPGFGNVSVYAPRGAPSQVVIFLSGDGGWNLGVIPMAEALRDRGALVAGVDIRTFIRTINEGDRCAYPAGDLERLSMAIQLKRGVAAYAPPILVGYSSGATLVYAALAAAPPTTFGGAVSLGFCPDLEIQRPPCQQNGLTATRRRKGIGYDLAPNTQLHTPWMVLQGDVDQVCAPAATRAFVTAVPGGRIFALPKVGHGFGVPRNWQTEYLEAYHTVARGAAAPPAVPTARSPIASQVRDLPLIEVPVAAAARSDTMAIIVTGDGGWADLDQQLAAGFAARGIPAVGWNSLRYYWTPRTPDRAAADLGRIITHYIDAWSVRRVIAVGYSFGADVLPFLVNRLPAPILSSVTAVAMLGPSSSADFEFRLSNWLGGGHASPYKTIPEATRLPVPLLCIRSGDEDDSVCRGLAGPHVTAAAVGRGHHFGGDYRRLVDLIATGFSAASGGATPRATREGRPD